MILKASISETKPGVVIMAGGKSSRMLLPKPWLSFNEEHTFLSWIVSQYVNFGCERIVVVLNHAFFEGKEFALSKIKEKAILIKNDHPEKGRHYSLKLAFPTLNDVDYIFMHNVDNPFVSSDVLGKLYQNRIGNGFVTPQFKEGGGHPILVSKSVLSGFEKQTKTDNLKLFLKGKKRKRVEVLDESILYNINTPEEYAKYFFKLQIA